MTIRRCRKGICFFEIDPTDFQAQLDVADGQVQNDEATLKTTAAKI